MPATIQKILKPSKYRAVDTSTSEQETYDVQTDGEFNGADDTNWQTGTAASISGGYAIVSDSGGNSGNIVQGFNAALTKGAGARGIKQGDRYRVQMVVEDPDSGTFDGRVRVVLYSESPGGVGGDNYKAQSSYLTSAGTLDQIVTISQTNTGNYHDAIVLENTNDPCNFKIASIKVTKLEFFGSNNHGQIYSGRALEFDGVGDYLDTGYVFSSTAHTICVWAKVNDTALPKHIFGARDENNDGILLFYNDDERIGYYVNNTDIQTTIDNEFNNTWVRIVATSDGSTQSLYINGQLYDSQPISETVDVTTNAKIGVRNFGDLESYFDGHLSDLQVWDTGFTASDALYDYNNPESLALNNGGTSLTESNLKLWYPMQDGHRGQQSYVLDGANTGLGDELCTNAEMNPDGAGWQFNNKWEGIADDTYVSTTNPSTDSDESAFYTTFQEKQVLFLKSSNASSNEIVDQSIAVLSGVTYKFHIRAWIVSGQLKAYQSNANFQDNVFQRSSTTGQWEDIIGYLTCDSSGNTGFNVGVNDGGNVECYIDFASAKPVNDKHHATTVFYGDELNTQANAVTPEHSSASEANDYANWTNSGMTNFGSSTDNESQGTYSLRMTVNSNADLAHTNFTNTVVGRTYRFKWDWTITNHSSTNKIKWKVGTSADDATNGEKLSWDVNTGTSQVTGTYIDFVATATTTFFTCREDGDGNAADLYLDNLSLMEVGTASGWTDADQQLDIPQPALQSYNQLAWWKRNDETTETDASTEYITIVDGNSSTYTAESVSFWFITNNSEEQVLLSGLMNITTYGSIVIGGEGDPGKISCAHTTGATNKCETDTTWHDGEWHHCTVIKLASDASPWFDIYVDGEKQSVTAGSGAHRTSDKTLVGARHSSGYFHKLDGCITEISAWNVVLTAAQVKELYNDGKALNALEHSSYASSAGNLEGYWRNNGLAAWTNLKDPGTNDGTVSAGLTETLLLPAGVDASRDTQGFIMNRQKDTNSLNFPTAEASSPAPLADNYVNVKASEGLNNLFSDGGSVSCWIYPFGNGESDLGRIFAHGGNYLATGSAHTDNTIHLTFEADWSTTNGVWSTSSRFVSLFEWTHLLITYNGSATGNHPIIYINGSKKTVGSGLASPSSTPAGSLTGVTGSFLLGNNGSFIRQYDGKLDDVLVYSDIIDDNEAIRIYNAGKRNHRNPAS